MIVVYNNQSSGHLILNPTISLGTKKKKNNKKLRLAVYDIVKLLDANPQITLLVFDWSWYLQLISPKMMESDNNLL